MPDSLLETSPENQLASSCFLMVALLLVECSAASPDFASSCCEQVTLACQQGPTHLLNAEVGWCQWNRKVLCKSGYFNKGFHTEQFDQNNPGCNGEQWDWGSGTSGSVTRARRPWLLLLKMQETASFSSGSPAQTELGCTGEQEGVEGRSLLCTRELSHPAA